MPATKHVPGEIILRIQLYRLLGVGFDVGGSLELRLRVHEGQHLPITNRDRELRLGTIRRERRSFLRVVEGDTSKPELLVARFGVGEQIAVLPCNANEHADISRLKLLRRQIALQRFGRLELLIENVAFGNEIVRRLRAKDSAH